MNNKQIQAMSLAERISAMEALWGSITDERPGLASPAWHKPVLADRRRKMTSPEAKFLSLAQLRKKLNG